MSKMRSDRRPPLAKSPLRLRPRRVYQSDSNSMQTPPGSITKSQKMNRPNLDFQGSELRPEYRMISCELRALANIVKIELGNEETENAVVMSNPMKVNSPSSFSACGLFERGRFYDEYSARRNERLKRKKVESVMESKTPYNLGVTIESSKRQSIKKLENSRKSVSATYSMDATPRYLLRSMSKENKKPPLPEKYVVAGERKVGTARRLRRI